MKRLEEKNKRRLGRKVHIRKRVLGTAERPRLSVFKSNLRLYVQVIDDTNGVTLVAASTLDKELKDLRANVKGGEKLGAVIGEKIKAKGIKAVVFDRNGYKYHGVVKAIAEATRSAGIQF
ncbi:MAG: 50S ribosomal protein L18 [Spirochaetaceae bacterium]|nr:50S ribosomal protein L18 [Spirochaetaceae bacterium]